MKVFFVLGLFMPVLHSIVRAQLPSPRQDSTAKPKDTRDSANRSSVPAKDSTRFSREKAEVLNQVIITARKPLVERLADRTIIHVDALLSNTGSNALEVLGNSPGLQVDEDGLISLKGKAGVLVLLDGKPIGLSGAGLAGYLKSLPAGVLDRIEIMPNPPARYQAEGSGGIINIKTKKNKRSGFYGSLTANLGTGVYGSSNNNLLFHYKNGRLNLFGSFSLAVGNNYFISDRLRLYSKDDGAAQGSLVQHYYESSNRVSPGFRLGLGYSLFKKDHLEIEWSGSAAPYSEKGEYHSAFLNAGAQTDSTMIVKSRLSNNYKMGNLDILYRHSFDSADRELTAGVEYYTSPVKQNQLLTTSLYNPDQTVKSNYDLLPNQPFTDETLTAKTDFTTKLGALKLETGYRSIFGKAENESSYSTRLNENTPIDSAWSNRFRYTETIHAFYASLSKEWTAFSIQAGLRMENTLSRGQVFAPDTSFSRKYTNLFPTLYFSFHTDSLLTHQFFLSAGRRINRPDHGSLNPSRFFFDQSNFSSGNPLLQPEFSYTSELSYVFRQNFTTSFQYSDTRDLIMQTFRQENDYFVAMPRNIGRVVSLEMDAGVSVPLETWWTAIVYSEFAYNLFSQKKGNIMDRNTSSGINVNPDGKYWRITVNNQLRFGHGWSGELSGFYKTKMMQVQSILQPLWYMNTSVQKKIVKDKCVISLGLRDLFHTRVFRKELNKLDHQDYFYTNSQDSRVLSLSVSFPFGNTGKNKGDAKTSNPKSEINRLKNIR
ncbi:outer membrane beta-barrel protein [Flavitalea flava]